MNLSLIARTMDTGRFLGIGYAWATFPGCGCGNCGFTEYELVVCLWWGEVGVNLRRYHAKSN